MALARRHPKNPKSHDVPAIAASISRFGFVAPVLVNAEDGYLAEGAGRVEALDHLKRGNAARPDGIHEDEAGSWLVPVVHGVHLSPDEAQAYRVASNRLVEAGGWHEEILAELLRDLVGTDLGLEGTGFSEGDFNELIHSLGERAGVDERGDPEEAPPLPPRAKVYLRSGDLVELGGHRLLVADSSDPDCIARVAAGYRASCLWTDPVWGVDYVGKTAARLTLQNDDAAGLAPLLAGVFKSVDPVLSPGARVYIVHPAGPLALVFAEQIGAVGWQYRQGLVWVKDSMVLGHGDHHYRHEPLIYAVKPGPGRWGRGAQGWYGGNDQTTVFEVPRPKTSRDHPTAKPVGLVAAMLRNSTRSGDVVLDPFTGSGSTLIACELLGRRFIGLDIDPAYAQVAKERWERYTGHQAVVERVS